MVGQKAPKCKAWTAKVGASVDDGDTLKPQIWLGNKKGWSEKTSVRVIGLNAPELSDYGHRAARATPGPSRRPRPSSG